MSGSDAPLPSSFDGDADFYSESRPQKLWRRIREEPLIPLGMILTVAALTGATRAMRAGEHDRVNVMFRRRIYAQGFTVLAMVAGSAYWQKDREKRKEFDDLEKERLRKEKHERWLRELEARDEEEKQLARERQTLLAKRRRQREMEAKVLGESRAPLETHELRGLGILSAVRDLLGR